MHLGIVYKNRAGQYNLRYSPDENNGSTPAAYKQQTALCVLERRMHFLCSQRRQHVSVCLTQNVFGPFYSNCCLDDMKSIGDES